MKMSTFPRLFLRSLWTGFYLRVLETGEVAAGDTFELLRQDPFPVTVHDITILYHFDRTNASATRQVLQNASLAGAWREPLEQRLTNL